MEFYLAQVNVGKIKAPIDSPEMKEFVDNLDPINTLAENSEGFIWRLKEENNNATSIKVYDDDFIIVNMSVWKDKDALYKYVYQSDHTVFLRRRKEWFEKMEAMYMALWYVPANQMPSVEDAVERLNHLREHGETPFSFSFKNNFTIEESIAFANSL